MTIGIRLLLSLVQIVASAQHVFTKEFVMHLLSDSLIEAVVHATKWVTKVICLRP